MEDSKKLLNDKEWLQKEVQSKRLRHIAEELGVPYSRVQNAAKKLEVVIPQRTKYHYTEESRHAKSENIKVALNIRYPFGRYGDLAANWRGGKPHCIECGELLTRKDAKRCLDCERSSNRKGSKNFNWQDGISKEHHKIRSSREYKRWKIAVYTRDDYTCVKCGASRKDDPDLVIHADHKKPFAYHPELRFDLSNGQTLCYDCHKETETYAGRVIKFKPKLDAEAA